MKTNYQLETDQIIAALPPQEKPTLLLHSCCGPCSTAVLEQLVPYFEIVLFYYNPNIAPEAEFYRRLETQKQVIDAVQHPHPITLLVPPYDDAEFWAAVRGAEHTPEMGERCERCIGQRMREAAIAARETGCGLFTTTLTVSPHKNAPFINACGEQLAGEYGVRYLPADFKKGGGYARSVALSGEYGLYRQDYCGCPMSLREAEARRAARENRTKTT
jgi:predicted adenine nucleotide alpha hydrolase (AANH) superfamily ATPase